MRRLLVVSLLIVVLVVIGSWISLRAYLRSSHVSQQVVARLETMLGSTVRVEDVDIGLGSTTLRGLTFYEVTTDGQAESAWLKSGTVTADVSLWDLINGNALPRRVTVNGASLVFRFNQDGSLATRLATPNVSDGAQTVDADSLPGVIIESSEVIFRKEGNADLVVKNIDLRIENEKGQLKLTGDGHNNELGKLILSGSLDKDFSQANLQLQTQAKVTVTQQLLERMPFVPGRVWQEIQIDRGDTSAKLTVRYDVRTSNLSYRLELDPENAKLLVPSIDLAAEGARGLVTVEDDLVQLRKIRGKAFSGAVEIEADLDFRGPHTRFVIQHINVEDVNVRELPDDWGIPAVVRKFIPDGKLTGNASLEVTIAPVRIPPADAAGLVSSAAVGFSFAPASPLAVVRRPEVHTKSKGKGQVRDPSGKQSPINFDWQPRPRRAGAKGARQTWNSNPDGTVFTSFAASAQPEPKASPEYLDLNLNLKDASLAEIVKNLELNLPFPIDGKASLNVKMAIPIERIDNWKGYKARGTIQFADLDFSGIKLKKVDADLELKDGILHLKSLKSDIEDESDPLKAGLLRGTGRLELDPPGEFVTDLTLERIPLARFVTGEKGAVQGTFSGAIRVHAPVDKLGAIEVLNGHGNLSSNRITVQGLTFEQIFTAIKLEKSVLRLTDLRAKLEKQPLTGTAELRLEDALPFQANVVVQKWGLDALNQLAPAKGKLPLPVTGSFSTSADVVGKLNPFSVKVSGDASGENVKVGAFEVSQVKFHWKTDGQKLDVKDLEVGLYGGKASGTIVVPMDDKATGLADLHLHSIQTQKLAKDLGVPFRMEGSADGVLKATLHPAVAQQARNATIHLDLKAPKLRVQNFPTEQLHGKIEYQKGILDYKLEGKGLGGTFDLEGQIPGPKQKAKKGSLSIRNVQLNRLFQALNVPNADFIAGRLNVEVDYDHKDGDGIPEGRGSLRITGVRWKNAVVSENLDADIILTEKTLRLRNVGGAIADGTLTGQFSYDYRQPGRSWFVLALDNVETSKLLGPWLEDRIEGPMQGRIRGNLADAWRGTAEFELTRGKLFGFDINQWRLPATWSYSPIQNRGQLDIHETSAQIARGKATGKMNLAWDRTARIEGNLRFANIDMPDFLRQTIGPSELGGGKMTGKVDFSGNEVRSLDDVKATINASFSQAQALQLPVLKQIAPFLGIGATTTFQKGDMLARLERGVLRIQQLTLQGTNAQVYMDGTVSLEGRLNLDVVAKTGELGVPNERLRLLGLRVPVAGPVPLVVIQEASTLLSNRVLYLQVTGTARSPVIRPRTGAILAEAAVRLFLQRYTVPVPTLP